MRAKPAIVILENVCNAPWADMEKYLTESGYTTASSGRGVDGRKTNMCVVPASACCK